MAQPAPARLPLHLRPRPKAPATSSSTGSLDRLTTTAPPLGPRAQSGARGASPGVPIDHSDKATTTLVRRVLCPNAHSGHAEARPLHDLLPPLTSSNDVDLQLYAIIAIIIKEFVYSWYSKITPDQAFVEEVVRIIAHCTRDLEQRLRRVDLGGLLLDEIPALLVRHIHAYRTAHGSQLPSPPSSDPRHIYHTLVPHPAFTPVPERMHPQNEQIQAQNEAHYRQLLIQGVLAVLLPTEDLQNACLRTLVADVLGDMILGKGVGAKACDGWLIWDGITKIVATMKPRIELKATGTEIKVDTRSRLEKFGLLSGREEEHVRVGERSPANRLSSAISEVFWRILQYAHLLFVTTRFIVVGLIAASSAPPRRKHVHRRTARKDNPNTPMTSRLQAPDEEESPILAYSIYGLISELLELTWRMPWVSGALSLVQWHLLVLQVGATDGLIDKFLYNLLNSYLLPPSRLPTMLLTLRTSLFPNNTMGPGRDAPSPDEQLEIKRQAAESILDVVPLVVARRIFAAEPKPISREINGDSSNVMHISEERSPAHNGPQSATPSVKVEDDHGDLIERQALIGAVEDILNLFQDSYMNKHLIFAIIELVFVRLIPELGEKGLTQLMEERGVDIGME